MATMGLWSCPGKVVMTSSRQPSSRACRAVNFSSVASGTGPGVSMSPLMASSLTREPNRGTRAVWPARA